MPGWGFVGILPMSCSRGLLPPCCCHQVSCGLQTVVKPPNPTPVPPHHAVSFYPPLARPFDRSKAQVPFPSAYICRATTAPHQPPPTRPVPICTAIPHHSREQGSGHAVVPPRGTKSWFVYVTDQLNFTVTARLSKKRQKNPDNRRTDNTTQAKAV